MRSGISLVDVEPGNMMDQIYDDSSLSCFSDTSDLSISSIKNDNVDYSLCYSPHSPDYSPNEAFNLQSRDNNRVYGEKITNLERLNCRPLGNRKILVDQLTFTTLNDECDTNENTNDQNVNLSNLEERKGIDDDDDDYASTTTVNSIDNNCDPCGGSNITSPPAQIDVSQFIESSINNDTINHVNKSSNGLIIIPSPTVRAYSSFVINRRGIPKLCDTCFRLYCVCDKNGIDDITKRFHNSRSYDFFKTE